MEPNSTVSTPVAAPVRLSSAQKRDLFGQTVAAIITTAIIAVPIVNQAIGTSPALAGRVSELLGSPTPMILVNGATESPGIPGPAAPARTGLQSFTRPGAPAVTPVGLPGTSMPVKTADTTSGARRQPPRKPLGRRLTGWLTGNGTHAVRPFPTVATARP